MAKNLPPSRHTGPRFIPGRGDPARLLGSTRGGTAREKPARSSRVAPACRSQRTSMQSSEDLTQPQINKQNKYILETVMIGRTPIKDAGVLPCLVSRLTQPRATPLSHAGLGLGGHPALRPSAPLRPGGGRHRAPAATRGRNPGPSSLLGPQPQPWAMPPGLPSRTTLRGSQLFPGTARSRRVSAGGQEPLCEGACLQRTLLTLRILQRMAPAAAAVLAGLGRPLGPAGVAAGRQEGAAPRA